MRAQANLPASPSYGSLFQMGSWAASQSNWVASIWIQGSGSIQLQALYNSTVLAETECTANSIWTQCSTPVFNTGSAGVNRFNIIGYYGGPATMYIDDTFLGPTGGSNQLPMLALKTETRFGTSTAVVRESTPSVNSASSLLAYGRGLKWFAGAKKESGIYGFIHLTFQEYIASVHIKEERLLTELD